MINFKAIKLDNYNTGLINNISNKLIIAENLSNIKICLIELEIFFTEGVYGKEYDDKFDINIKSLFASKSNNYASGFTLKEYKQQYTKYNYHTNFGFDDQDFDEIVLASKSNDLYLFINSIKKNLIINFYNILHTTNNDIRIKYFETINEDISIDLIKDGYYDDFLKVINFMISVPFDYISTLQYVSKEQDNALNTLCKNVYYANITDDEDHELISMFVFKFDQSQSHFFITKNIVTQLNNYLKNKPIEKKNSVNLSLLLHAFGSHLFRSSIYWYTYPIGKMLEILKVVGIDNYKLLDKSEITNQLEPINDRYKHCNGVIPEKPNTNTYRIKINALDNYFNTNLNTEINNVYNLDTQYSYQLHTLERQIQKGGKYNYYYKYIKYKNRYNKLSGKMTNYSQNYS